MSDKITIIIVDDHTVVRQGVRAVLETQSEMMVVGEAASGEQAVELCVREAPDVVLIDLIMPGGINGVEATRQIKEASPRTNVIVLTSFHEDQHILPAVKAGALSYLLKDVGSHELIEAVKKAACGEVTLHPRVAATIIESLQDTKKEKDESSSAAAAADLSRSEREVLKLIADGLSNAEIGERLYISEKTVKSHVSNILSKLHLANRTQAAIYAWRNGLVE